MQFFVIWMQTHLLNWFMAGYQQGYAKAMQDAEAVMAKTLEDMTNAISHQNVAR